MYQFYTTGNKVICVTTYAGKTVRGVAKCNPLDAFDIETGKRIAQARCDVKVAKRRVQNAVAKRQESIRNLAVAQNRCDKMTDYVNDAMDLLAIAVRNLNTL